MLNNEWHEYSTCLTKNNFRKLSSDLRGKYVCIHIFSGLDMIKPTRYEIVGRIKHVHLASPHGRDVDEWVVSDYWSQDEHFKVPIWECVEKRRNNSRQVRSPVDGSFHWVHAGPLLYLSPEEYPTVTKKTRRFFFKVISEDEVKKLKFMREV